MLRRLGVVAGAVRPHCARVVARTPRAALRTSVPDCTSQPNQALKPSLSTAHVRQLETRVAEARGEKHVANAIEACRLIHKLVARHGQTPKLADLQRKAYEMLLSVFAHHGLADEALLLLRDMEASLGAVAPLYFELAVAASAQSRTASTLTKLLGGEFPSGDGTAASILPASDWTVRTYTHLMRCCEKTANLEMALVVLFTARDLGVVFDDDALLSFAATAHQAKEPRLALEVAQVSGNRAPALWMRILRSVAEYDYAPGLDEAWAKATDTLAPDEGLFVQALHAAARASNDALAESMLDAYPRFFPGAPIQEWHLTPLFDAYCQSGRFGDAIAVLQRIKAADIPLSSRSLARLARDAGASTETLAQAVHAALSMHDAPIEAVNALLYAAADRGEMPAADQLWQSLSSPNLDTHEAYLLACLKSQHLAHGEAAWRSLSTHGIQPTSSTYEKMARLYLTQPDYDEAFTLLEEAKQRHVEPTRRMYTAMIYTCLKHDDARWRALSLELKEAGHDPGARLREAMQSK